ncbi:ABC transporter related protein [Xylanimonas cellulosilytica DSM 15894]|uniref:ABC transporter related protein n=1 Tax=Xylanimonas cellulosilytica (strain DSM 15894 / JCM 12276 / CECT 5975 / KCTC 9989 / LMG 20990 / NBRC 107835 / XIL07) TaxID=446471 RepID=D1BT25_XYLCX|nr:ABC transporter ATP-binding protein [Xylanimonas cellulosilytica]ACZ30867.1 ABC transporter related protein [Xylanimonas cellulosilytica DSM 15894]
MTLLEIAHLRQTYGRGRSQVVAVDDLSLTIAEGETFGLVGESGSGKTTTGRAVVGLQTPSGGTIRYRGQDLTAALRGRVGAAVRREVQMVFQDPYSSLDPRMRVRDVVAEGLAIARDRRDVAARVEEALDAVGLGAAFGDRYPHELSGGQRQRVGIARALVVEPRFVVLDEPISALDVSVQAQVVNLLDDLKRERGLTYLFIAHDLAMVRHVSDRIGVMRGGRLVEVGPAAEVWAEPLHPYTRALLSAVPLPDPDAERDRVRVPYDGSADGGSDRHGELVEVSPGRLVRRPG